VAAHRGAQRSGERARGSAGAAFRSLAWFAGSDDNGASHEVVKPILNPGNKAKTIGNQIVVLPNDDLVMLPVPAKPPRRVRSSA
jgi:hypothetical protein